MKAVSTFVITVALVVGLVGCGPAPSPTPTQYNLTTSGTDGGEVTSPGEATFTYDEGTVVNLVAEAEEGYRFVEWTGDVDTIGNVSAAISTITMNGDHSVAANFASSVLIRVGSDFTDYGKDIAMDAEGNMYVAGYFQGTVDFDPGQDIVNKTAFGDPQGADGAGQVGIFLAKYDKYGLLIWVNTFGGNGPDMPHSMTLDKDGNIYIVGYIGGSFDIDTSSGARIVSSGVGRDILLAKFGNDGRFLWAHSFGDPESGPADEAGFEEGIDIDTDSVGNVYIVGVYNGKIDMDPSDGNDSKDTFTSQERDIIVASYDTNGAYRWGFSAGGSGRDGGHGIKTGTDGSIILTGFFSGTANLDPLGNNSGSVSSMGGWDIFLAKYDSNVKLKWVNSWGGSGNEQVRPGGIAVDRDNDIYLCGDFASTVDFDPGSGVANLTSKGLGDIFLAKYDTNGNYIWATGFGGSELDGAHRIDVDSQGNLVITGWFRGTVDFDPSPQGSCILTAKSSGSGASDIFLAKYDNNGNYVWAYSFGDKVTTADEWSLGTGVAIDSSDNVAATGRFYGGIDFDTTDEVFMLKSAGMADVFIIKYDETGKPIMRRN